jgi:hypothetical protein
MFLEIGVPFWRAVTLAEHAEWLARHNRADDAEPLLLEARETFQATRGIQLARQAFDIVGRHRVARRVRSRRGTEPRVDWRPPRPRFPPSASAVWGLQPHVTPN